MRRPKASLKKYFYFTLICALLLIFGFNIRESEVWKTTKAAPLTIVAVSEGHSELKNTPQQQHQQQHQQQSQQQQHHHQQQQQQPIKESHQPQNDHSHVQQQEQFIFGNSQNDYEYSDDYDNGDPTSDSNTEDEQQKIRNKFMQTTVISKIRSTEMESTGAIALRSQIEEEKPNILAVNSIEIGSNKSWFFKNGKIYPKSLTNVRKGKRPSRKGHSHGLKLFPHQDSHSDRIVNQLMYMPNNYEKIKAGGKLKSILLYNGVGPWSIKQGREVFLRSKCPVDTCELTAERERANTVDMILYKDFYAPSGSRYTMNIKQVTMLYYLECPYHTHFVKIPDAINWTATYRRDSDIVAPYEKWVYYDDRIRQMEQDFNYAENKTKKVAWFVSNCGARNGRLQYAHELAKYIDVDIYGYCGNFKCSRNTANKCFELLDRDYKFYLAFENSNCRDYITEKFFVNALSRNILPIVMGARPEDYEISAPHRSYIHVDEFTSAKELADYLHVLDKDDKLYNSYFHWKGTGEFINTYFWCRVCAALHDEESLRKPRWYADVNDWWRGPGVCTIGSWRNYKARQDVMTDD